MTDTEHTITPDAYWAAVLVANPNWSLIFASFSCVLPKTITSSTSERAAYTAAWA